MVGLLDALEREADVDPDYSFQLAAFAHGVPVLDMWAGPHLDESSLLVPYSSSKVTIGLTVALLVQRGQLDLDARVASYWPEFGEAGKSGVTVRQLLSHQAGIPETWPVLSADDVLGHHGGAARLAAMWPLWRPGSAFGYHGVTIGLLADELVHRATGRTLHEVYEEDVRAASAAEVYLGIPERLEHRMRPLLPMSTPADATSSPEPDPLLARVFGPRPGEQIDLANDPRSWRFGAPAVSASASARGLARLLAAAITGVDGEAPLLSASTVAVIGEQQVRGYDEVIGQNDRAFAIVFQNRSAALPWGGPRSFGHDGAAGAVACVDPDTGIAFGYTVARGPWPGGGDPRALDVARRLGRLGL